MLGASYHDIVSTHERQKTTRNKFDEVQGYQKLTPGVRYRIEDFSPTSFRVGNQAKTVASAENADRKD